MSGAQRLKGVFAIEIDTCACCQGRLRVIASIEEPEVIARCCDTDAGGASPSDREGSRVDRGVSAAGIGRH